MSNPIKLRAFILGALAVMFLATTVYAAEPIIKDVPQSHWAYDAVSKLVSKGYLSINNLGEFQGNQPVDRYNLAQALGRLLDDIESGKVRVGSEDVELLRKLTNEYREELVMYYAEQQRTAATLTEAMKRISILDEKINTAIVVLEDITVRAELLQQNVTESNETQVAQTTALQNDITNLQLQLADSISRLQAEAEAIKASIRSTEESLRSETQALVSGVSVSQDQKRAALDSRTTSVEIRTTDLERRMSTEEGKSAALANQLNNQQDILSMQISNTAADLRNEIEALRRQAAQERNAAVSSLEAKLQLQSDMLKQAQDDLNLLIAQHRSELIGMINANAVADAKAAGRIDALEQGQSALQGTVNSHGTAIESLQNTQENQDEEIQALSRRFTDYQEAQNTRITGIEEYNKLQDGAFDNKLAAERNEREKAIAALDAKQAGENAALAAQLRADMQKLAEDSIARDNALQKELNSRLDVEIATRDAAVTALEKKLEQQTADLAQKVFADQLDLEGELLSRLQTELDDLNSQIVAESDARASAVQALDAKLVAENAALAKQLQADIDDVAKESAERNVALHKELTDKLTQQTSRLDAELATHASAIKELQAGLVDERNKTAADIQSLGQKQAAESATREAAIQALEKKLEQQTADLAQKVFADQLDLEGELLSRLQTELDDLNSQIVAESDARASAVQALDAKLVAENAALAKQLQADIDDVAKESAERNVALHKELTDKLTQQTSRLDAELATHASAIKELQAGLVDERNKTAADIQSLGQKQAAESATREAAIQALEKKLEQQTADLAQKVFADQLDLEGELLSRLQTELDDLNSQIVAESDARASAIQALDAKLVAENAALAKQLQADIDDVAKESAERNVALHKELTDKLTQQTSRLDAELATHASAIKELQAGLVDERNKTAADIQSLGQKQAAESATREAAIQALEKKLEQQTADLAQKVFADQLDLEGELLSRLQTELDDLNSQIVAESDARASAIQALDAKLVAENAALAKQLQADIDDVAKESAERSAALHKELTEKLTQQSNRLDEEITTRTSAVVDLQAELDAVRKNTAADIQSLGQKQADEAAVREAAIKDLEKKLEQQTADLAQKVFADQLDLEGELLSRLQTELDDLNSQIVAESDARASAIQALDAKLVAENAALAKQLQADIDDVAKESAERSAALHKELTEKLTQQSNRLDEEITTRTSAVVDLQAELDAVRKNTAADIQSLGQKQADEAAVREAAIKDLEKKLEQQTADLAQKVFADQLDLEGELLGRMQSELDELSKQISSEREDRTAALQSLDAKQTTANTELADQLQTAIDNVAKASTAGDEALMQQLTDGLADQSRRLDAEIANRTAAIKDLEKNIAGQTALLSSKLAEQQAQLDAERKERDAAIKELDEKHMAANTSLASQLQKQFADGLAEQSSRIDAEKAARETAVQNLEKQLEQQTADLAHKVLTDQLDLEGALLDKLQTELANQQAQIDTEREERKAAVQALDAKQAAENTQLQSNIDKLAQEGAVRYETLQKQLADGLAAQSSRLDAEIATRAATIKDLEKSLAEQSNRIDVERAAREAAVEELDKKLAAQTAQLAAEVVAKFEQMESEGQLSEQALLNKMQTELDSQSAQIAAERDVRAAADKALDAKLAEGLQQLTTRIDTLAAESMKRDQELENKQKADTEQLVNLINAEAATRQNAISSLDAKFTQQTNDLALKLATQFDALSQESAESNASILHQLQTELGKQQERITAEQVARESGLQALADEMKAADKEIETTLEERFSDTEKELNRHSESLAAQQLALMELEERFMAALKAQEEAYQQQLAALQAELEQTKQELATMQTKLLVVESRIGLSDTQLEALDRRINEKVDQYLTARYMNEAQLGQQIQELELKLQLSEEHAKKEIGKVNTMSWVKAVMATLIGVFVTPW
ncbi:MAG: S-layer homology domain-containing protein [Limnochordia bacterium]